MKLGKFNETTGRSFSATRTVVNFFLTFTRVSVIRSAKVYQISESESYLIKTNKKKTFLKFANNVSNAQRHVAMRLEMNILNTRREPAITCKASDPGGWKLSWRRGRRAWVAKCEQNQILDTLRYASLHDKEQLEREICCAKQLGSLLASMLVCYFTLEHL